MSHTQDFEYLWEQARALAQDEGRRYMSIKAKGRFNF